MAELAAGNGGLPGAPPRRSLYEAEAALARERVVRIHAEALNAQLEEELAVERQRAQDAAERLAANADAERRRRRPRAGGTWTARRAALRADPAEPAAPAVRRRHSSPPPPPPVRGCPPAPGSPGAARSPRAVSPRSPRAAPGCRAGGGPLAPEAWGPAGARYAPIRSCGAPHLGLAPLPAASAPEDCSPEVADWVSAELSRWLRALRSVHLYLLDDDSAAAQRCSQDLHRELAPLPAAASVEDDEGVPPLWAQLKGEAAVARSQGLRYLLAVVDRCCSMRHRCQNASAVHSVPRLAPRAYSAGLGGSSAAASWAAPRSGRGSPARPSESPAGAARPAPRPAWAPDPAPRSGRVSPPRPSEPPAGDPRGTAWAPDPAPRSGRMSPPRPESPAGELGQRFAPVSAARPSASRSGAARVLIAPRGYGAEDPAAAAAAGQAPRAAPGARPGPPEAPQRKRAMSPPAPLSAEHVCAAEEGAAWQRGAPPPGAGAAPAASSSVLSAGALSSPTRSHFLSYDPPDLSAREPWTPPRSPERAAAAAAAAEGDLSGGDVISASRICLERSAELIRQFQQEQAAAGLRSPPAGLARAQDPAGPLLGQDTPSRGSVPAVTSPAAATTPGSALPIGLQELTADAAQRPPPAAAPAAGADRPGICLCGDSGETVEADYSDGSISGDTDRLLAAG